MDNQERITALEAEKKQYIQMIDILNAEKISLDQMLVESLKSTLECRKNLILKDKAVNELNAQVKTLNQEKNDLQHRLDSLNLTK